MSFNKQFWKSKTMWAGVLTAVIPTMIPAAKEIITQHPEYVMGSIGFIFSLLRITTTKPLVIKKR